MVVVRGKFKSSWEGNMMHIYVGFEVFAFTYLGGSKSTSPALLDVFPCF